MKNASFQVRIAGINLYSKTTGNLLNSKTKIAMTNKWPMENKSLLSHLSIGRIFPKYKKKATFKSVSTPSAKSKFHSLYKNPSLLNTTPQVNTANMSSLPMAPTIPSKKIEIATVKISRYSSDICDSFWVHLHNIFKT
eukprot:NODE_388_length_8234_cov_1.030731.p5 type:complete len:138 gc:universal NODE_388_length_8234_cov_1.030731:965-1378(+)